MMHLTSELFNLGIFVVLAAAGCHMAEAGERLHCRMFDSLSGQVLDMPSMCGSMLAPLPQKCTNPRKCACSEVWSALHLAGPSAAAHGRDLASHIGGKHLAQQGARALLASPGPEDRAVRLPVVGLVPFNRFPQRSAPLLCHCAASLLWHCLLRARQVVGALSVTWAVTSSSRAASDVRACCLCRRWALRALPAVQGALRGPCEVVGAGR